MHRLHELITVDLSEQLGLSYNAGIGEHDIQLPILLHRLVHDLLDFRLIPGIELPRVDVDAGI